VTFLFRFYLPTFLFITIIFLKTFLGRVKVIKQNSITRVAYIARITKCCNLPWNRTKVGIKAYLRFLPKQ